MPVTQYLPAYQVTIYQITSGNAQIDVTDWIGDGCSIRTRKSVREPAGAFEITLLDKVYQGDSLYGSIAPMDVVDIRGAHNASDGVKLLMRGFVTSVSRQESIGQDGKPTRRVIITGHDIGKLMETQWLHFVLGSTADMTTQLSGYGHLLKWFGDKANNYLATDFVRIWAGILDSYFKKMTDVNPLLRNLSIAPQSSIEGSIPYQLISNQNDVSFWQFASLLLDIGAFNEMFMQDSDAGANLVVRPNFPSDADGITIPDSDLVAMSTSRSDANTANFFWVTQKASQMIDQSSLQWETFQLGPNKVDLREDPRCSEAVYGWRPMMVDAHLFPPTYGNQSAPRSPQVQENINVMGPWLEKLTDRLVAYNADIAALESGVLRVRGNEAIQAGTWVSVVRGDVTYRFYAVCVEHEISIPGSWITAITFERGDGWKQRQAGGLQGRRYQAELNLKGVYGV